MADDGIVTIGSARSARDTIARVEAAVKARGATLFAKIDHAAGAAEAGVTLPPTTLIIFGSARAGTPLMQSSQRAGIDLPLKALVWEDDDGKVWLTYNDPAWIATRHSLDPQIEPFVHAMSATLSEIAQYGTGAGPDNSG